MAPPSRDPAGIGGSTDLAGSLVELISRHGPVRFDTFLEHVLYDERWGFYDGGGGAAGRSGGHFLTSPEVGPLFGAVVARAVDGWWERLGRPDPFVVVEAGAGPGTLAVAVRAATPACASALTWVLVERSATQRTRHAERLPLSDPAFAVPPAGDEDRPAPAPGTGPRFASVATMPVGPVTGVVLANELLDNLPFRLLERGADGWLEVRVGLADDPADGQGPFAEVLVDLDDATAAEVRAWAPAALPGSRIPVQAAASAWLRDALALIGSGVVAVVDYADSTPALAARPWQEWVRTYRGHERGGHPLAGPGSQDITCEVAVDQLARVRRPDRDRSQALFLDANGIDDLVEEGRRTWEERAHIGDLAALAARSRIREAEALRDPAGLGAFRVLEWDRTASS